MSRAAVVAALLAVAALAGCGGSNLPTAGARDAERAQARWPGTTVAELDHGRSLYVGHCGTCHLPVSPTSFAADAWPTHVGEMQERAGLTPTEAESVQRYLITMASK